MGRGSQSEKGRTLLVTSRGALRRNPASRGRDWHAWDGPRASGPPEWATSRRPGEAGQLPLSRKASLNQALLRQPLV